MLSILLEMDPEQGSTHPFSLLYATLSFLPAQTPPGLALMDPVKLTMLTLLVLMFCVASKSSSARPSLLLAGDPHLPYLPSFRAALHSSRHRRSHRHFHRPLHTSLHILASLTNRLHGIPTSRHLSKPFKITIINHVLSIAIGLWFSIRIALPSTSYSWCHLK